MRFASNTEERGKLRMKKKKHPGYWLLLAFFVLMLALGVLLLIMNPQVQHPLFPGPRMMV